MSLIKVSLIKHTACIQLGLSIYFLCVVIISATLVKPFYAESPNILWNFNIQVYPHAMKRRISTPKVDPKFLPVSVKIWNLVVWQTSHPCKKQLQRKIVKASLKYVNSFWNIFFKWLSMLNSQQFKHSHVLTIWDLKNAVRYISLVKYT